MRSIMMILGLLFIALCHPSFAQKLEERTVRVAEGAPLTVECPLRVEQRAQWRRDGGALPADLRPAGEAAVPGGGGAVSARLHAAAARVAHAGVYACARGPDAARVRVLVQPHAGTEPAAPATPAAAPEPQDSAPAEWLEHVYELHRAIELDCKPGGGADAPPGVTVWKVNGTEVTQVAALAGRYELKEGDAVYSVARSTEDDWGNYTCLVAGAAQRGFRVKAKPVLKMADDSNVVEGQKLKLTCRVRGRPYPAVTWTYAAAAGENETDALQAVGERGSVQASAAGVPGGELLVEAARRSDAGVYSCHAPGSTPASTTLRVKDMYAALWPFLGICAEVFILCAIILVYEKRRTKPELDDSDTDNHDQ